MKGVEEGTEAFLELALDGGSDDGELEGLVDELLPRDAGLGARVVGRRGEAHDAGAEAEGGAGLGQRAPWGFGGDGGL